MKNDKLLRAIGGVDDKYIEEASPSDSISSNQRTPGRKRNMRRFVVVAACVAVFMLSTTVFAAAYIQNSISSFYMRYLCPEDMAVADSAAGHYGSKVYFDALKSDDIYKQYFAINKLVEYYNDEETRTKAVNAIIPFLANPEEKLSDAAAFALSVLESEFDDPRIIHLADGSVIFTLLNDYSDYGSYNQIWRIVDGEMTKCMTLNPPHMYIRYILPSPDARLFAVVTGSNKSGYVWIYDVINGYVSMELIDSARILVAKDMGYALQQRIDFENYSGLMFKKVQDKDGTTRVLDDKESIYWTDNNTLEFKANLRGDAEEIEEFEAKAVVRYDFQKKHMEYRSYK